jgi:hypothetical protein
MTLGRPWESRLALALGVVADERRGAVRASYCQAVVAGPGGVTWAGGGVTKRFSVSADTLTQALVV